LLAGAAVAGAATVATIALADLDAGQALTGAVAGAAIASSLAVGGLVAVWLDDTTAR
jgi:hypothetical protein